MRILTVRQPWAWAIIHGQKDVENRVRNIAGGYRGPVAIHAGLSIDSDAADSLPLRMAWHEAFLPERKLDGGFADPIFRESWEEDASWMPTGAIIGVVDLIDVHPADSAACYSCLPWADDGGWHLVLANPRALDEPIPYRGALGLRTLDADMVARIEAAMA